MTTRLLPTAIAGLFILETAPHRDDRGTFARLGCVTTLSAHGITFAPRQTSLSRSFRRHTLRGMHFQIAPAEEVKIVHCLAGAIHDVVFDPRPESPTFGHHFALELNHESGLGLVIPASCAHGFLTLTDNATVHYQIDRDHDPACARGLRWDDPFFGVSWPAKPAVISDRDASWPDFQA
jgi:dTDP-4-dehydrorhamnose 3,5-epimerase